MLVLLDTLLYVCFSSRHQIKVLSEWLKRNTAAPDMILRDFVSEHLADACDTQQTLDYVYDHCQRLQRLQELQTILESAGKVDDEQWPSAADTETKPPPPQQHNQQLKTNTKLPLPTNQQPAERRHFRVQHPIGTK